MKAVIAAALFAVAAALAAVAAFGRYEIAAPGGVMVYRVDRMTGEVEGCKTQLTGEYRPSWPEDQPGWCQGAVRD